MSYPTTPKPRVNGSGGNKEYVIIESKFEGNYTQTRRGATRGIETFDIDYKSITWDEYNTLLAFFDANVGGTFTFVHPTTAVTHTVKFVNTSLSYKYETNDRVSTSVTLVEA